MEIILASSSPYRKAQLKALGWDFSMIAPQVDETKFKSQKMSPRRVCARLALEKARAVAKCHPHSFVIGSDQLVHFKNKILGKPGSVKKAIQCLQDLSGQEHHLITSLCVIYKKRIFRKTVIAKIRMRKLSLTQIKKYVETDNPIDCAGSYKLEKAGMSLIATMRVSDPSSLVGLPLISLCDILIKCLPN